jgi:hypothetical protein
VSTAGRTAVLILTLLFFSIFDYDLVLGQGQFLTYENPDYNISIQYPNNWIPSEENLAPHQVVSISAPEAEEEESSVSTIIYIPAELIVAVQPLYSPGMTMNQFIDQFLNETYSSPNEYRIIESSNATFAGMPAQKIVMYEYVGERTTKIERTIGIQNGTAYMTKYVAEPGEYSTYYPIAQRMIDSFQPSLRQRVAAVPQVLSNLTQSQNGTEPLAQSTLSEQPNQTSQGGILLQPPSGDLSQPAQLPDELLVTDNVFGDSRLPLESYMTNGFVTDVTSSRATKGELSEWYPIIIFNFNEPSQLGLVNVEHVLSGPIKSYDSPDDILEDANYWKDVPLNEQIVLEMNQPGLNYLVAAVQFANGTYGVYSGTMDVDAFGAKSDGEDYLDFQMDEGADLNIHDKSDIEDIQSDPGFQQAASDSICSELNKNGFQVCQQEQASTPNIEASAPTTSSSNSDSEGDDNEGNDGDNGDDGNGGNGDDGNGGNGDDGNGGNGDDGNGGNGDDGNGDDGDSDGNSDDFFDGGSFF